MSRRQLIIALLLGCSNLTHSEIQAHPDKTIANPNQRQTPPFNQSVLALLSAYPEKGEGGYQWPAPKGYSGTTRDLYINQTRIAHGGQGSHCVGITFEVFFRALEQSPGGLSQLNEVEAREILRLWFVPEVGDKGVVEALTNAGLGTEIPWREAIEGDFFQVWMNGGSAGHSAIFLGWTLDEKGQIAGVRYWSSQPWTDGIGIAEHPIGEGADAIDPKQFYVVRVTPKKREGH
jgi:hypothetical protein